MFEILLVEDDKNIREVIYDFLMTKAKVKCVLTWQKMV